MSTSGPFELLLDIERRCRESALGIPQETLVKEYWSGIGFRMADSHYVAPLGEVTEILPVPTWSGIPMTRAWVRGVANVRGSLVPIMDLKDLLLEQPTQINKHSRVLIVSFRDTLVGFLVEHVFGLRHFGDEEKTSVLPSVDERIRPYLKRAYWQDKDYWGVFSMYRLVDSPVFMQVAV